MGILVIALIGFVIWIAVLTSHIRRTDCSDTDKIVWTVILCTLNILGVVLYLFMGPSSEETRVLSEQELKDKFNRGAMP